MKMRDLFRDSMEADLEVQNFIKITFFSLRRRCPRHHTIMYHVFAGRSATIRTHLACAESTPFCRTLPIIPTVSGFFSSACTYSPIPQHRALAFSTIGMRLYATKAEANVGKEETALFLRPHGHRCFPYAAVKLSRSACVSTLRERRALAMIFISAFSIHDMRTEVF